MQVLAVLDLKAGEIVRGVAGERARYRPIISQIAPDSRPETVTRALVAQFGCRDIYLADLDAIGGAAPSWETYERVAACGVDMMIDAGVNRSEPLGQFCEFARHRAWLAGIVVGLESAPSPAFLHESSSAIGPQRALFSLDLKGGIPLTSIQSWREWSPQRIATYAVAAGFRRLIVLDLAAVGTGQGPATAALCRDLRSRHAGIEIISGGGVRSAADVQLLLDAGCDRVLVASALHDGGVRGAWCVV